MKGTIFSTILAAALVVPTAAFAGQRGGSHGGSWGHGGWGHGGWSHGGHAVVIAPYYGGFYGGWAYYDPFWGSYAWGAPYEYGGYVVPSVAVGHLRIEATPKDAQVFVDGNYAGVVDNYDGHFQHLDLPPGGHHIELKAQGFTTDAFDIYIQPNHTTDYKGKLSPLS